MAMGGGPAGGPRAEINVTPLIDVCLVLLVIFLVVAPVIDSPSGVRLPEGSEPGPLDDDAKRLVASMGGDRIVRIGGEAVPAASVEGVLREARRRGLAAAGLAVEADRELTFGDLLPLLEASASAGFDGATLAARKGASGSGGGR